MAESQQRRVYGGLRLRRIERAARTAPPYHAPVDRQHQILIASAISAVIAPFVPVVSAWFAKQRERLADWLWDAVHRRYLKRYGLTRSRPPEPPQTGP